MKYDFYQKVLIVGIGILLCTTTFQTFVSGESLENEHNRNESKSNDFAQVRFNGISNKMNQYMNINYPFEPVIPKNPVMVGDSQITTNELYDGHPAIMCDNEGNLMANYENEQEDNQYDVGMSYSTNGGASWSSYHWNIPYHEEMPDIDYTGSERTAIGTFVPDPELSQGSAVHFTIYPDIIDPEAGGRWQCSGGDLSEFDPY